MNTKTKIEPLSILRIFLGLVFLSAGIYRVFFFDAAQQEFLLLQTPSFFIIPLIIFEIVCGGLLLLDKYTRYVLIACISFLSLALVLGFVVQGGSIIKGMGELFVFDPTPTDVFLHVTFLTIMIAVYVSLNPRDN